MKINIGNKTIGENNPVFIVAELSANHNQDFNVAIETVKAAKEAGADAIKLQTYTPDTITIDCDNEYFLINQGGLWDGKTLYELYQEAHTPWEWQPKLKQICEKLGLDIFSSPFDVTAVDFLEEMGVPAYKVASLEVVDLPLLRKIARTGKPVIMSTGTATLAEIDEAVRTVLHEGCTQLALLKCTSAYPARPEEMNLRTIPHMAEAFCIPVGLSDHTLGFEVAVAAVAIGACIVEKHLTLSRSLAGPDSAFSLEPKEFKAMVAAIRNVEKALGTVRYGPTLREKDTTKYRRSLFVAKDMSAGEKFTIENLRVIRPGFGLPPKYYEVLLGKTILKDTKKGTPLCWELIM